MQPVCAVQVSFYGITADNNGPLKQVNAHTDDDRYEYDMVELGAASESLTDRTSQISYGYEDAASSQISYEDAASLPVNQPGCAVQMSFYGITADYNGPLKPANAHTDDDRYDMVELGAAAQSLIGLLKDKVSKRRSYSDVVKGNRTKE